MLGADVVLEASSQLSEQILDTTDGIGADVVIEAAGRLETVEAALTLARRGGTVLWFGVPPESEHTAIRPFWINENEITIRGSFNNPLTFSAALKLVSSSRVRVEALDHRLRRFARHGIGSRSQQLPRSREDLVVA